MKPHACFRVSVDEVAEDFAKYAELAKTRTFEIYDRGKVEVLLVRIEAIQDWHDDLQINVPRALISDHEIKEMRATSEWLKELAESGDRWPDEEC